MTDRQMLFSGPMVRALLDGRKTQTRRVTVQPPNELGWEVADQSEDHVMWLAKNGLNCACRLPCAPGDRLWVREACATWAHGETRDSVCRADLTEKDWASLTHEPITGEPWKRRPSIHMPRWASRLTLIVTDVRVQRLQEISDADAIAEGIEPFGSDDGEYEAFHARTSFEALWQSLNAARAPWDSNPWVCAVSFAVQQGNIDLIGGGP